MSVSTDHFPQSESGLRPPAKVMRLQRLGAFHQTRISFVRTLVRKMSNEKWSIETTEFDLDDNGFGHIIYRVTTPDGIYDFVAFSTYLDDSDRSDRVIAERWDSSFALVQGAIDAQLLDHLKEHVPLQEAGRMNPRVLVLSRANRSVRLFQLVIDALENGQQPPLQPLIDTGYLMRTTAVYGNGKFGLADFGSIEAKSALGATFRAQMLAVYLIRLFSYDLVNHIARRRAPERAIGLCSEIKKYLGIGNATGLGMAPFLVSHPTLINQWISQRERAIARVSDVATLTNELKERFVGYVQRAHRHYSEFSTDDSVQQRRYEQLLFELEALEEFVQNTLTADKPWEQVVVWAEGETGVECQELVNSLIIEMHPDLVDDLGESMNADEPTDIDASGTVADLVSTIESEYVWALSIDFEEPKSQSLFWYRSEEKAEPRLGQRFTDAGAELEMNIGVGREIARLHHWLRHESTLQASSKIAELVLRRPGIRGLIRRIQNAPRSPYGEIQDNLIGEGCRPIDLLRCKLSFFGASRFDPKSDLWTRITLFQGAPLPEALRQSDADDWVFPVSPDLES